MPANVVGIVYVVLSALCFSAKAIFAKLAYRQGVDASTVLALRMLAAFPFFALAAVRAELRADSRLSPADTIRVVVLGSGGCYLAACLDFLGLQYITASLERLILFLYPTLVVAFRYVLHSERPPPGIRLAIVLSYSGVVLSASQSALWSSSPRAGLGVLLVFGPHRQIRQQSHHGPCAARGKRLRAGRVLVASRAKRPWAVPLRAVPGRLYWDRGHGAASIRSDGGNSPDRGEPGVSPRQHRPGEHTPSFMVVAQRKVQCARRHGVWARPARSCVHGATDPEQFCGLGHKAPPARWNLWMGPPRPT